MAFKEVFEKHQEGKGPKKSKDPLEELIMNYITRFRKKKSKKVADEPKEELEVDESCKWCQGTGISPKDKKQENYCRYCGGTGKVQKKHKKKKKIDTVANNLNSNNC